MIRTTPFLLLPLAVMAACSTGVEKTDPSSEGELGAARAGEQAEVDAIVMGGGHLCALLRDATVRCWGGAVTETVCDACRCREARGAAAIWSSLERSIPGLEGVVDLAAGASHTCAVIRDGSLRCWGGDESVLSTGVNSPVTAIEGVRNVVDVTTEFLRTCARLETGEVRCWGGPIAPNGDNFVPGWFAADGLASARRGFSSREPKAVANTSCIESGDGAIACERVVTSCVNGNQKNAAEFFAIKPLRGGSELALGATFSCGVRDRALLCTEHFGTIFGGPESTTIPNFELGASSLQPRVAASGEVACFVHEDKVSCMGHQAGRFYDPVPVAGTSGAVAVTMGTYGQLDTCALRNDSSIVCWKTAADGSAASVTQPLYLPPEAR